MPSSSVTLQVRSISLPTPESGSNISSSWPSSGAVTRWLLVDTLPASQPAATPAIVTFFLYNKEKPCYCYDTMVWVLKRCHKNRQVKFIWRQKMESQKNSKFLNFCPMKIEHSKDLFVASFHKRTENRRHSFIVELHKTMVRHLL